MLPLQQIAAVFMGILAAGIILTVVSMYAPEEAHCPQVRTHTRTIKVWNQRGMHVVAIDKHGHRTAYTGYTRGSRYTHGIDPS